MIITNSLINTVTLHIFNELCVLLVIGFIFINCTSVNGTQISRWVYQANNTLCTPPKQTSVGKDYGTTISDEPWYISK